MSGPWDQRYAGDRYFYGTEPNAFLLEQIGFLPAGGQVLCLAEGEGRNAVHLASAGFLVTAMDQSAEGLRKAGDLARSRGVAVDLRRCDLADTWLGRECWDGVVAIFAHLPPEGRRLMHRRVVEALKPGGVVILEAYAPEQVGRGTGGPPDPTLTMTPGQLREEFEGLDIDLLQQCERPVLEGEGHTGVGAVVQLRAVKREAAVRSRGRLRQILGL